MSRSLSVLVAPTFTPRDFLSPRFRVYLVNGAERRDVTRDRQYGEGLQEACLHAAQWAQFLDCPWAEAALHESTTL